MADVTTTVPDTLTWPSSIPIDRNSFALAMETFSQRNAVAYSGTGSFQPIAVDLTLSAAAGGTTGKFVAPIMGNVFDGGAALTKAGNYLGGLIGHYSITNGSATTYPEGAILGGISDGVSDTHVNAFVAYIDGDSAQTIANAAFKVMYNNSTAGSGFNYGVDLFDAAHDGFNAVTYKKADISLSGSISATERLIIASGSAADDAAIVTQVGADSGVADGSLYLSTAGTGAVFVKVSDVWVAITHA